MLLHRRKRLPQRFGQAQSLFHNAPQLGENRRFRVGLVVLLIADAPYRRQAAMREAGQFALHRAGTPAG